MSGAITAGTIATVAGIGAAGSIGGALIGSHAAGSAADKQMSAADKSAQLQYQESQDALNFQKQQWNQTQQNALPWLQQGGAAENQLGYLLGLSPNSSFGQPSGSFPSSPAPQTNAAMTVPRLGSGSMIANPGSTSPTASPATGIQPGLGLQLNGGPSLPQGGLPVGVPRANPVLGGGQQNQQLGLNTAPGQAGGGSAGGGFGSLLTPYSGHFTAPDALTEQNDPGYKARMALGTDAIQRSAAARGGVLTGGTAKALDQFSQDYGSNEYGNVYNRALTGFQTGYNQYNNDQNNIFNRLSALAGGGQTSAGQLASSGQAAANNVSQNLLNTGQNIGQDYQNAGAANASGIIGGANAWTGALGSTSSNIQQLLLLKQLGLG